MTSLSKGDTVTSDSTPILFLQILANVRNSHSSEDTWGAAVGTPPPLQGEGRPKTDFRNTTVEFSLVESFLSPPTQQSVY